MATSKHVENLVMLRARLRGERRVLAEKATERRDLIAFGELQRSFEAVAVAIKDETEQADAEAERVRMANQPDDQEDQPYKPMGDDPK